MRRQVFFGTRQRMRWIKTPSPGSTPAMAGATERFDFSNGGVAVRDSVNGHMEWTLTWNLMTRALARQVTDYAYKIYGDGPFYFLDPFALDQNVLNKAWSAPGITAKDGVPLAGRKRPTIVPNLDFSRDYPADMARYALAAADARRSFYVPIPAGYTAWVSAGGDATSTLGIAVQRTNGGIASGAPTNIPVRATSAAPTPTTFASSSDQSGILLSIQAGTGVATIAGIMVQLWRTGVTPSWNRWISGQGAGGCRFEGRVHPVSYNLPNDQVGLSVKLVEVEDWL